MIGFKALNTRDTHTLGFHVLQNGVPVAVLSNHKWHVPNQNDPQRWTLYRLSDFAVLAEPEELMTVEGAQIYFSQMEIAEKKPEFRMELDTAYGFKLYYSDKSFGLTRNVEEAKRISELASIGFFEEHKDQHFVVDIPGDWIKTISLVNVETKETVRVTMPNSNSRKEPLYKN